MPAHDPRAELAPRDIVARAIWAEMSRLDLPYVHLDISHRPRAWLDRHFPAVTALCAAHGIDIATQPMPVAPCALCLRRRPRGRGRRHRHRRPARRGRSRAHRPAWRQPAGQQFAAGMRGDGTGGGSAIAASGDAANAGALAASSPARAQLPARPATRPAPEMPGAPDTIRAALRRLMQQQAGIIRSDEGLADAAGRIAAWRRELPPDADPGRDARWLALRNQLDVCGLIVDAARAAGKPGAHASSDWPAPATRRAAPLAPGAVAGYAKSGRGSRSPGRAASLLVSPHPNAHAEWPASPRAIPTRPLAPAPAWPAR